MANRIEAILSSLSTDRLHNLFATCEEVDEMKSATETDFMKRPTTWALVSIGNEILDRYEHFVPIREVMFN